MAAKTSFVKIVQKMLEVLRENMQTPIDIDMILHFTGDQEQRKQLELWLEGWSMALAEINYLKTGYLSEGLLDAHIITDEDIAKKTSYTYKIGAVTDPATPLGVFSKKDRK